MDGFYAARTSTNDGASLDGFVTALHRSARYGRELDVSARLALDARWAVEIKGARFDGTQAAFADRDKVWAAVDYRF